MADPGLIMMVRERWPGDAGIFPQSNTTNWAAVKFWQTMGLSRVILSRELSLEEVEEIRQQCPDMELEVSSTARCASPTRAAACLRLLQPPRPEPGHLYQQPPLGLQGAAGKEDAGGDVWLIEEKERLRRADADRGGRARHLTS